MAPNRTRTRLVTGLAVVALASLVFGWSSAGGLASSVTIAHSKGTFSGVVTAESPCQAGRSVTVHKVDGDDVGTATTDNIGGWKLEKKGKGKFFATVAASTVQVPGGDTGYGYGTSSTTCDSGTSTTIEVKRKHHHHHRGGGGGGGGGAIDFDKLLKRLNRLFDQLFPSI